MSTTCEGCGLEKRSYRSYGGAAAAASWAAQREDAPLRVYYSSRCACWHLTSRVDLTGDVA